MSTTTGIVGTLSAGWNYGGPACIMYGWPLVCFFTTFIGLSMAEITSGLPCAGGPYFWSAWLGGKRGPLYSWITAWFNILAQVATLASVTSELMAIISTSVSLHYGIVLSQGHLYAMFVGTMVCVGLMNSGSTRVLLRTISFSLFWQVLATVVMVLVLPTVAPWHQSASFVWKTSFGVDQSTSGITSKGYLYMQSLLLPQYAMIGYDACAHMSEETTNAGRSAPRAILLSLFASYFAGYILLIGMLFCVQDPSNVMTGSAGGFASFQIVYDAFTARFGNGSAGILFMLVPTIALLLCLFSFVTSSSRLLYSFARNQGLPFSKFWSKIDSVTHTPRRTVWLATCLAIVMGLPLLQSFTALAAVTTLCTGGSMIAYGIPIACKLTVGRGAFVPGSFHLGRWSDAIGTIALIWIAFSVANFMLPSVYPITLETFNFTPVAVICILIGSVITWYLPGRGACYYFQAPKFKRPLRSRTVQR
ncbi:hypothetical protein WJX73_004389 [Symbiochloris irregularis]|uniref:Amino acid transporter n=1 Tax=Symbiochloris irregularis TaxID=706552 RepID=A0AAW1NR12_9CHLO